MILSEVEKRFLRGLANRKLLGLEQYRDEEGCLVVRLLSPCDVVGYMSARITAEEIFLSCRLTHSHAESGYYRRSGVANPDEAMIQEAVDCFADFVQGSAYVHEEIGFDGRYIKSGWHRINGKIEPNPKFRELIEKQHGGPSTFRGWGWRGEMENVGADY